MANVEKLSAIPSAGTQYMRAALGAIPLPFLNPRGKTLPDKTVTLTEVKVDPENLADYCKVTGLRFGDSLPMTYPFTLTTPLFLELALTKGFPYPLVGLVHMENVIEQFRPISVSESLDLSVRVANLREHSKGMLFDSISEVRVGRELVWRQTATFLRQQKTSLSGGPKSEKPADEVPPTPTTTLKVTQKVIDKYAAASGDKNVIHVSTIGAKAFGFPGTIAHGMWTCAAALQAVEGKIPAAVKYSVRFGKPIMIPAKVNLYADAVDGGWDLSIKNPKKGYPHMTATLR